MFLQLILCEPTGFFGQTGKGMEHLWILQPKVYITAKVPESQLKGFSLKEGNGTTTLLITYPLSL